MRKETMKNEPMYTETQVKSYLYWCACTDNKATTEGLRNFIEEMGEHVPFFSSDLLDEELPSFVQREETA